MPPDKKEAGHQGRGKVSVSQQLLSFNRSVAMDRVGGDEELLREIAGLFLSEYPKLMDDLHQAVIEGNAERMQHAAHTLKGSLGTLGAEVSLPLALELEMKGRRHQLEGAAETYEKLRESLAKLHAELAMVAAG
jgi:HPt (histidine-containing phosphotransfer) domain-containing protein